MPVKRCSTCKETKPLSAFARLEGGPMGLQFQCRACKSEYNKRYQIKLLARRMAEWCPVAALCHGLAIVAGLDPAKSLTDYATDCHYWPANAAECPIRQAMEGQGDER